MRRLVSSLLMLFIPALFGGLSAQAQVRVEGVRMHEAPNYTRVVFDTSAPVRFELFSLSDPERVVIDIAGAKPGAGFSGRSAAVGRKRVKSLRTAAHGDDLRIVLDVNGALAPKGFALKPVDPYGDRLVVDLFVVGAQRSSAPPPRKPKGQRDVVIALDAGHGGEDPGALAANKALEKHVTMQVARRLKRLLDAEKAFKHIWYAMATITSACASAPRSRANIVRICLCRCMPMPSNKRTSAVHRFTRCRQRVLPARPHDGLRQRKISRI